MTDVSRLTIREMKVLRALSEGLEELGYVPSQRELSVRAGWAAASTVTPLLQTLQAKGYVRYVPGQARAIVITPAGRAAMMVAETEAV